MDAPITLVPGMKFIFLENKGLLNDEGWVHDKKITFHPIMYSWQIIFITFLHEFFIYRKKTFRDEVYSHG